MKALLNTKCIALLPILPKKRIKDLPPPRDDAPAATGEHLIARDNCGLFWHVINSPFSRFTEFNSHHQGGGEYGIQREIQQSYRFHVGASQ